MEIQRISIHRGRDAIFNLSIRFILDHVAVVAVAVVAVAVDAHLFC